MLKQIARIGLERVGTIGTLAIAAIVVIAVSIFSGSGPLQRDIRSKRSLEAAVALRHPFDDMAGKPTPEMHWRSIDGRDVDLQAPPAKTVIFVFSLDYCPPCDSELSALRRLAAEPRFSGVRVIGIVRQLSGREIPEGELISRLQAMPLHFPLVLDSPDTNAKLGNIKAVPVTIYIDKSSIVMKETMSQQYSDLAAVVSRLQ